MKEHFPLLKDQDIAYLDSAATTQKPAVVIRAINDFYMSSNANIHRGLYPLSVRATELYDQARAIMAAFIGADASEVIFTKGTTDSINALAHILYPLFGSRKEIVLTELEHHANLIPWQELSKAHNLTLRFIRIKEDGELDYEHATELIGKNTALVSFTHISNTLGTTIDAKRIVALCKLEGAISVIDAAQSIAHQPIHVRDLGCDFLVFSGHKMYGPTGIGVMYGRKELLEQLTPYQYGGGMIREVTYQHATYADVPQRFEAGTPNIAGAIGLARAAQFIQETGWEQIRHTEERMYHYLASVLAHNGHITIHSPPSARGLLSFTVNNAHPHDVAEILAREGVCIRAGHHCTMPLIHKLGVPGLCRASIALYTTKEDIDKLAHALQKVKEIFT